MSPRLPTILLSLPLLLGLGCAADLSTPPDTDCAGDKCDDRDSESQHRQAVLSCRSQFSEAFAPEFDEYGSYLDARKCLERANDESLYAIEGLPQYGEWGGDATSTFSNFRYAGKQICGVLSAANTPFHSESDFGHQQTGSDRCELAFELQLANIIDVNVLFNAQAPDYTDAEMDRTLQSCRAGGFHDSANCLRDTINASLPEVATRAQQAVDTYDIDPFKELEISELEADFGSLLNATGPLCDMTAQLYVTSEFARGENDIELERAACRVALYSQFVPLFMNVELDGFL